jgi:hypothetical protein
LQFVHHTSHCCALGCFSGTAPAKRGNPGSKWHKLAPSAFSCASNLPGPLCLTSTFQENGLAVLQPGRGPDHARAPSIFNSVFLAKPWLDHPESVLMPKRTHLAQ